MPATVTVSGVSVAAVTPKVGDSTSPPAGQPLTDAGVGTGAKSGSTSGGATTTTANGSGSSVGTMVIAVAVACAVSGVAVLAVLAVITHRKLKRNISDPTSQVRLSGLGKQELCGGYDLQLC
jgi:hypothetical protein